MRRPPIAVALSLAAGAAALALVPEPRLGRATAIVTVCLVLWLTEAVPAFLPTVILWLASPLLLSDVSLPKALAWSADPVLTLFFGGFALGVAARRHGLDAALAQRLVRASRGRRARLLGLLMGGTAVLSMWMSNVAAAAMMIAASRPVLAALPPDDAFRRAVLVAIAMGGNFGGLATPVGTGPNGIAIAAAEAQHHITFAAWMLFGVPLAIGLIAVAYVVLVRRHRVRGAFEAPAAPAARLSPAGRGLLVVFGVTVVAWLTEPLHGVAAALVALAAVVLLFGAGLLARDDLAKIDWGTLLLIAGGIGLGRLIEHAGLVDAVTARLGLEAAPATLRLLVFVLAAATMSALMSNTGTATMLIPLALQIDPAPSTAVLVAVATSLGAPFVVSTPPNAMVYGEGGVTSRDLLVPGLVVMLAGAALVTWTGPLVLRLFGVP